MSEPHFNVLFLSLPLARISGLALKHELDQIGRMEGATGVPG